MQESPLGLAPILRPGGNGVKYGMLFTALKAIRLNLHGKDVCIPECGGAAMTKSPWNAPDHPYHPKLHGYVFNNKDMEALALFNMMRENDFREDFSTVPVFYVLAQALVVLDMESNCTLMPVSLEFQRTGKVQEAKQIIDTMPHRTLISFAKATVIGLEAHNNICTSLSDFYFKCGCVDLGRLGNCLPEWRMLIKQHEIQC
ncbi:hypothetical protein Dimus_013205 [Dionaea muscipula]